MFAVGMELDMSQLKRQVQTAIVVSHSSIVIPYLLGVTLALFLYQHLAQPGASFTAFALFLGISMSITAFPVLVRILKDRNIFKTALGSTATACAAVDDVTAWTILAFVIAIARASSVAGATFAFGLVIVFVSSDALDHKTESPQVDRPKCSRPNGARPGHSRRGPWSYPGFRLYHGADWRSCTLWRISRRHSHAFGQRFPREISHPR